MKLSIFYSIVFSFLIFNLANAEQVETDKKKIALPNLKCDSYKDVSIIVPTTLRMEIMYFDAKGRIQAESIPLACRNEIRRRHNSYSMD